MATRTQAQRLYDLFGGAPALLKCMARAASALGVKAPFKSTVYRWQHIGCPSPLSWRLIEKAAEIEGVALPDDIYCPRDL